MTVSRILCLVGVAVLVLVANVLCSVLYMVVYGHLINPGHDARFYQDHIQMAGPYCSIVAGIPILFATGFVVAGWWNKTQGIRSILLIWGLYTVIDLSILFAAGMSLGLGLLFVVSFATKLLAGWLGARHRLKVASNTA